MERQPIVTESIVAIWQVARKLSQPGYAHMISTYLLGVCNNQGIRVCRVLLPFTSFAHKNERWETVKWLCPAHMWRWLGTCTRSTIIINLSYGANKLGTLWSERSSSSDWALSSNSDGCSAPVERVQERTTVNCPLLLLRLSSDIHCGCVKTKKAYPFGGI